MSATTDIYVTPSTSLVLIKSLSSVTNVYLGSFPTLFSVSIRDTTGLSSIRTNPVRISTIQSTRFTDGSSYYALDQPYGFVNLSLRTSTSWQINHTSGKPPASSAANIDVLSTNSSFFTVLSTSQKIVSTFLVENLTTPNTISITGPFVVSNLSTPGFVLMNQTLFVQDNVVLCNTLNVSAPTTILSSLFTEDITPLNGQTNQVMSSIGVGQQGFFSDVYVKSTLFLRSTVQIQTLQITLSSVTENVVLSDSLRAGNLVSSLGNFAVGRSITVGGDASLTKEISSMGGFFSTVNLSVDNDVSLRGSLSTSQVTGQTFVSSLSLLSSLTVKQNALFESTLGVAATFYTSSLSTVFFSTLGSVSTLELRLLSTASITGNVSTAFFQSYQYISIGGDVYTPASLSSLSNTQIKGSVYTRGNSLFLTAHTSSSVGVGNDVSVRNSTFVSHVTTQSDFQSRDLLVTGSTEVQGNVGVGGNGFVYGNLTVLGEPTISSFLVESFLLSNLQIMTSSPFVSFRVSSLHASTLQTDMARVSSNLPDVFQVSTTFASSSQLSYAIAELASFDSVYTDSLFVGDTSALSSDSFPRAALNKKTLFAQGLSTNKVYVSLIQAASVVGNLIGSVDYLSNTSTTFQNFSVVTTALSSLTVSSLYTSSFQASTFVVNKFANVFSSVITPYLVFESQGFQPRFDTNQFLTLNPKAMVVNRSLTFDRQNNKVGLFMSTPLYDFDISGEVYASNVYFSSINSLSLSTTGTVVYSTIVVSSTTIQDKLSYGVNGLHVYSRNPAGLTFLEFNTAVSSPSGTFGILDCVEQSTILLNSAVQVYRNQRVSINGATATGELLLPYDKLVVKDTIRTERTAISTVNLLQSLQSQTILSPTYAICSNVSNPLNTLSASIDKLCLNTIMTVKNDLVGIQTLNPLVSLDVRGNAFFSSLNAFENLRANYVLTSFQEF
jgi:hypothetical protein